VKAVFSLSTDQPCLQFWKRLDKTTHDALDKHGLRAKAQRIKTGGAATNTSAVVNDQAKDERRDQVRRERRA
jgi:hypothetical protein